MGIATRKQREAPLLFSFLLRKASLAASTRAPSRRTSASVFKRALDLIAKMRTVYAGSEWKQAHDGSIICYANLGAVC